MDLKNIIDIIKKSDSRRAELDDIKNKKEILLEQYILAKNLLDAKEKEEYEKLRELHNCSHMLLIMYNYLGIELTCLERQCVCCGYSLERYPFLEQGDPLVIEMTLHDDEPDKIGEIIRQRLVQIFEVNPNLSLEEAKNIIADELPSIEKSIKEERNAGKKINHKCFVRKRK